MGKEGYHFSTERTPPDVIEAWLAKRAAGQAAPVTAHDAPISEVRAAIQDTPAGVIETANDAALRHHESLDAPGESHAA